MLINQQQWDVMKRFSFHTTFWWIAVGCVGRATLHFDLGAVCVCVCLYICMCERGRYSMKRDKAFYCGNVVPERVLVCSMIIYFELLLASPTQWPWIADTMFHTEWMHVHRKMRAVLTVHTINCCFKTQLCFHFMRLCFCCK